MTPTCDREERIRRYARLAAEGKPLFDAFPSIDGSRLVERATYWACGKDLKPSRWNTHTFVSRPFMREHETYCVDCFAEHGWPEPDWEVV